MNNDITRILLIGVLNLYIFPWWQPELTRRAYSFDVAVVPFLSIVRYFDMAMQYLDVAMQYFEEILLDLKKKSKELISNTECN